MHNFLLYHHGGSANHGCEAIVRTVTAILSKDTMASFLVASHAPMQDHKYFGDASGIEFRPVYDFLHIPPRKLYLINTIFARLFRKAPLLGLQLRNILPFAKRSHAAVSIGGDVYSYGRAVLPSIIDKKIRKSCKTSVLLGCSINKEYLDPVKNRFKIENLRTFDLIVARESLTYQYLNDLGFENTELCPDPAFVLPCAEDVPTLFDETNTIGINVSPLVQKYEAESDQVFHCFSNLIRHILKNTEFSVALIPHVVCKGSDDRISLTALFNQFKDSGRIVMIEDGSCMELKSHISRCRIFHLYSHTGSRLFGESTGNRKGYFRNG